MANYAANKKYEKMPSGKYRGWIVSCVPYDYFTWLNHYGRDTKLYQWLHNTGSYSKITWDTKKKMEKQKTKSPGSKPNLAQGVKNGPAHSDILNREITTNNSTTIIKNYPKQDRNI